VRLLFPYQHVPLNLPRMEKHFQQPGCEQVAQFLAEPDSPEDSALQQKYDRVWER